MSTALIILGAGKGTRMKSDLPKVLHKIAGAPLLAHAMRSGAALDPAHMVIVAGHGFEEVEKAALAIDPGATVVRQREQLGTGHAADQAREALRDHDGDAIVLFGDTPHIQPETLHAMGEARKTHDVVVLGFDAHEPGRYGRLIMQGQALEKIVEFKDANAQERAITLCNSGVMAAKSSVLFDLIAGVSDDNAAGEYYLTDIVAVARARGLSAGAVLCDEAETLGINSRADLAAGEAAFQARVRQNMMNQGVTMTAPETVFLSFDTQIGRDTVVEPNVVFGPGVRVASGAYIRAFSHLEGTDVASGAIVGPYARLRPGTRLEADAKIGNFVETKAAHIAAGAKVSHLSYVGDAAVGARANIGAGTITCNYDGVMKHKTSIGEDAFIGSNTMLVAPVSVGNEAMTASGSVITSDVPDGDLGLARARQDNKAGFARKLMARLRAIKASKDKR